MIAPLMASGSVRLASLTKASFRRTMAYTRCALPSYWYCTMLLSTSSSSDTYMWFDSAAYRNLRANTVIWRHRWWWESSACHTRTHGHVMGGGSHVMVVWVADLGLVKSSKRLSSLTEATMESDLA